MSGDVMDDRLYGAALTGNTTGANSISSSTWIGGAGGGGGNYTYPNITWQQTTSGATYTNAVNLLSSAGLMPR